jgi:hypothetical protein
MTDLIMSALISLFLSLIARGYQAASSRETWTGCLVDRPVGVNAATVPHQRGPGGACPGGSLIGGGSTAGT